MLAPLTLLILGGGFEVGGDAKAEAPAAPAFVWRATEIVEKGGDKTFVATGTKKGHAYLFRARGVCIYQSLSLWSQWGLVRRQRVGRIFGIDFRVTFGAGERQIMSVGERKPEQTELAFTADSDDVAIRIQDNWELPPQVSCTIDGIEVVQAP